MSKDNYSFNDKKESKRGEQTNSSDLGGFSPEKKAKEKKKWGKIIGFSVLGVFLVFLIAGGIYLYQALAAPESIFNASTVDQQSTPEPMNPNIGDTPSIGPSDTQSAPPTPTPEPFSGEHIVNVLLLGLDSDHKSYAEDGGDTHSDAMIVLAINFDKNTVDMISLPRDTFTHIPGVKGIYKLNGAINCGGGKTESGFKKVCEAASYMLGGISIDYYYAFDMNTVIEIGDMIGGVDFDVEAKYTGSSTRRYKAGMQHLDGTGIYDYMRARKNFTAGAREQDTGRMDRCKAMLKAIFQKLKNEGTLTQIPELLGSVSKGMYTNMTLQQSIALANYAYSRIDGDLIGSHTMKGDINYGMSWKFYWIDQKARQELIKQVYGIDVPEQQFASREYAGWLYNRGFKTIRYLATAQEVSQYIINKGIDTLSPDQKESYDALIESYNKTQAAYDTAALSLASADTKAMEKASNELRKLTTALAKSVGYPNKLSWTINYGSDGTGWIKESCINEIFVDFE